MRRAIAAGTAVAKVERSPFASASRIDVPEKIGVKQPLLVMYIKDRWFSGGGAALPRGTITAPHPFAGSVRARSSPHSSLPQTLKTRSQACCCGRTTTSASLSALETSPALWRPPGSRRVDSHVPTSINSSSEATSFARRTRNEADKSSLFACLSCAGESQAPTTA